MKSLLITCFISLIASVGFTQQVIIPAGGVITNFNGSIEYSLGQLFFINHSTNSGSIDEGIHQPSQSEMVTSIVELKDDFVRVEVFPNPSENLVHINLDTDLFSKTSYYLMDLRGRVIEHKQMNEREFIIDMTTRKSAIYILNVFVDGRNIFNTRVSKD